MVTNDVQTKYRVVYAGTGRRRRFRILLAVFYEDERTWRQRLATEMEEACREMTQDGFQLTHVVPVISSEDLKGGSTEGAWLYFATN